MILPASPIVAVLDGFRLVGLRWTCVQWDWSRKLVLSAGEQLPDLSRTGAIIVREIDNIVQLRCNYQSRIISLALSIWLFGAGHCILPSSSLIEGVAWYSGTWTWGLAFFAGDFNVDGGSFRFIFRALGFPFVAYCRTSIQGNDLTRVLVFAVCPGRTSVLNERSIR